MLQTNQPSRCDPIELPSWLLAPARWLLVTAMASPYGSAGQRTIFPNRVKRALRAGETVCVAAGLSSGDDIDTL